MRKASLAEAKARLSELVDEAEHRGRRIVILRHGKPAAAIVPVEVAVPKPPPRRLNDRQIQALFDELAKYDQAGTSAVEDLRAGRR